MREIFARSSCNCRGTCESLKMSLKKKTRWVIRRPMRILIWEEYWEKLREKKLFLELKKIEVRLDSLEESLGMKKQATIEED